MGHRPFFYGVSAVAVMVFCLCWSFFYHEISDISRISESHSEELSRQNGKPGASFSIGVVSRFAPAVTYETYQPLIDHLNRTTPYNFKLKLGRDYDETVEQLATQEVVAAFLGSYIFGQAREHYAFEPLLRPLSPAGTPMTRSSLITRADGPIQALADLKNRSLALPSPASFSGNWLTRMALQDHGLEPTDLKEIRHFAHHHTVVFQVLWGRFDVGVVRETVALEYLQTGIKILASSPYFSGAPLVVHQEADSELVQAIKQSVLSFPPSSLEGLRRELAYGFVEAHNEDYDLLKTWADQMNESND